MKKRIISAAAAIALIFGTAACLPQNSPFTQSYISASAAVSGDWSYTVLSDGTISLDAYTGSAAFRFHFNDVNFFAENVL